MRWSYVVAILLGVAGMLDAQIPQDAIVWEANIPGWVDINAVATLKGGAIVGDTAKWTRTFEDYDRDTSSALSGCVPIDMQSVILQFSITSSGYYRVVAYSPVGDTAKLLLTLGLWIGCGYNPYGGPLQGWDGDTQGDTIPVLYNPYADFLSGGMLRAQSMISWIARMEFGHIKINGAYSGPIQRALYEWRTYFTDPSTVRMYSTFTKPLWVVYQAIFHEQADYSWYKPEHRELDLERNARFSVAPSGVWDLTFSAKKGFDYNVYGASKVVVVAVATNDNGDSSAVRLDGNDLAVRHNCCNQDGFSISPPVSGTVELSGYTVWSWLGPMTWLVSLADSVKISAWWEQRNGQLNPPDAWDQNHPPLILKIGPYGAVPVEEEKMQTPPCTRPIPIVIKVRSGQLTYHADRPVDFVVFDHLGRSVVSRRGYATGTIHFSHKGLYFWRAGNRSGKVLILNTK